MFGRRTKSFRTKNGVEVHVDPKQTPSRLLELHGVGKVLSKRGFVRSKPSVVAARDITSGIRRGEAVALVGESGSGGSARQADDSIAAGRPFVTRRTEAHAICHRVDPVPRVFDGWSVRCHLDPEGASAPGS